MRNANASKPMRDCVNISIQRNCQYQAVPEIKRGGWDN